MLKIFEIIWRYIRISHQNDPVRTVLEIGIFLLALHYLVRRVRPPRHREKYEIKLSEKEIDDKIKKWSPQPIVEPLIDTEKVELDSITVVEG